MNRESEEVSLGHRESKQFRERKNSLTESDEERIKVIVESVVRSIQADREKNCRFSSTHPEDLEEVIKFYRKFNEALDDSKNVVRRTIIALMVGGVSALLGLGILSKIKTP